MSRADREQDLIAYYTGEIQARVGRDLPEPRVARRTAYLDQLRAEGRNTVLELGYGPGRFFSIRSDDGMREVFGRHGELEQWTTWKDGGAMHYQWAVLRVSAS